MPWSFKRSILTGLLALGSAGVMLPVLASQEESERWLAGAEAGDSAQVQALLQSGSDPDASAGDGSTALHHAVRRKQLGAAQLLLDSGADPNATTQLSVTPLMLASRNGDAAMLQLLIGHGADLEARDHAGETLLMAAARSGDAATISLLLQHGADPEARDTAYQQTALIHAARAGQPAAVAALLEGGADVLAASRIGEEPPFRPNGGTRGEGVEKAPERGMRAAIPGGKTALHFAARDGHAAIVAQLLEAGADINEVDPNGITPLIYATSNNRMEVAQLLIERGADIAHLDWYGRSALWSAIDVRNMDSPNPALGNGIDRESAFDVISLLLERGADPNTRIREMPVVRRHILPLGSLSWVDFTGETPFIRAALAGDVQVMRLLLQHGADPLIATQHGTTALMAAAGVNWVVSQTWDEGAAALLEAVQLCFELGIDVNAANSKGVRAIHGAANRGSNDIIRFLAENGAELDVADANGRTPLDWARGVFLATHPPLAKPETMALLEGLLAP